jgi:isopenicillin N synthase-like dioxygenase
MELFITDFVQMEPMELFITDFVQMERMDIPVIDPFQIGAEKELHEAFITIGFAYIKTDIDVTSILNYSRRFFSLPTEKKDKIKYSSTESNVGYQGMIESLTPGTPVDLKEAFNWCEYRKDNVWYDEEQKKICLEWNKKLNRLTNTILILIEKALNLSPFLLVEKHIRSKSTTSRILHYPIWNNPIEKNQMRGGEHTDYGTITLLFTDGKPGLQIKPRESDAWISAPHIPETCIVNVGDLLQRWTNDLYVSTPHRVINSNLNTSRYSFPYFVHPNDDVQVDSLVGEQKYQSIGAKEYLVWRLNQSY